VSQLRNKGNRFSGDADVRPSCWPENAGRAEFDLPLSPNHGIVDVDARDSDEDAPLTIRDATTSREISQASIRARTITELTSDPVDAPDALH